MDKSLSITLHKAKEDWLTRKLAQDEAYLWLQTPPETPKIAPTATKWTPASIFAFICDLRP